MILRERVGLQIDTRWCDNQTFSHQLGLTGFLPLSTQDYLHQLCGVKTIFKVCVRAHKKNY